MFYIKKILHSRFLPDRPVFRMRRWILSQQYLTTGHKIKVYNLIENYPFQIVVFWIPESKN